MNYMAVAKREHDRVFQMRVSDDFLSKIDEWRRLQTDIPPRAEAIRRLIDRGLHSTDVTAADRPAVRNLDLDP